MNHPRILFPLFAILIASLFASPSGANMVNIKNIAFKPDYSRLPQFYSSDPKWDEFANEWFMRHLSVDDRSIYTGGVKVGILDVLWVVEWDWWMLPWIDRGAMGSERQGGQSIDAILTSLENLTIDKYGYVFGAKVWAEPRDNMGGWVSAFSWPWPKYNRNYTVSKPTGWDFNDIADGGRDGWECKDVQLEPGYVEHSLVGTITGPQPEILTPKFDCDVFQIPLIELDITYRGQNPQKYIDGLKIYWATDQHPEFSEDRMVTVDYCHVPPRDFPGDYAGYVNDKEARYPIYFPMCLHPEWGRDGRRITRLKIIPAGPGAEGVKILLNYVRCSYDCRLTTTNATLINAAQRFYTWSADDEFLKTMMPRLRRSMIFLGAHMRGKSGLIKLDWFGGKDGLGDECGHGVYGSYWDLLPGGLYDLDSNFNYYYALKAMADLERVCKKRGIAVPDVQVLGADNKTMVGYHETPESLEKRAAQVKANIEKRFWNPQTGRFGRNIDVNGKLYDYGWLHHNLVALAMGIGTPKQRDSILSWVTGRRVVAGDTATGADIYHWRFGPRISTKRNETYYYWAWPHDRVNEPGNPQFDWGNQMQDGGGVPFTSLFDLMARCKSGKQSEIDAAYERTKEIEKWYEDVKSAGGKGPEFYRKYYDGHPERGLQQSPKPGGLGLDHEFLSDGSLGTEFIPLAFLGIDAREDGILDIRPALPSQLDKLGCSNIYYRGNYIDVEAGRGYVSLEKSRITNAAGLKVRVTLNNLSPKTRVTVGGKPIREITRNPDGSGTFLMNLKPVRVEIGADTKVRTIEDIVYAKVGDKELHMGLALPTEQSSKPRPVVMWITGGGWKQLSYKSNRAAWFAEHGYVGAHIDYRLSNEAIFPAQIHDCKAAIRFLRAHAKEYNIDPDHIGVWGGSAGGHLAALLATTAGVKELEGDLGNNDQSSRVQACCGWYGVYDLTTPEPRDPAKKKPGAVAELLGGRPEEKPELAKLASPIRQITKDDAPTLLFHGENDQLVPMQQSARFCEALKAAGVEAQFVPVRNGEHGFSGPNIDPSTDKMLQMMLEFFDKHLKVQ